ncbi:uncharacterized protein GGS22DRAFT_100332 [Annulohypoxylon maeteangense]|uniref:uncharacterized protein n=1 Tax=Annulohypoxylon maeteangense TaxID=1927788 RepID=UPI0020077568|nr:uncharacterized protein GGS22DRAFT_100332 [Annulohypoxylon maeteangense]KAI0880045.1 hypothetical protein GGS22DRAFT_100332 [Annulohypoxylon maeteangense]
MLRLLRSRPNPFTLASRVHGSTGPTPQVMRVQRVRIRRKWFKPKSFMLAGFIYYVCYQVYDSAIFMTLSAWLDEQEKHLTRKEREEIEEDMLEPMFFPIPFTTRVIESPPYKGSDPEWQTFIRINKDQKLVRSIQDGLAEIVRKTAMRSTVLVQRCGNDMSLSRYWLHIIYPTRPPPTFVHKGISIGDEVAITEEPIDTTTAIWIQRALWPYAVSVSLWSFSGALVKQNILHVARLFGYDPDPDSTPPSLQQTIEEVQQRLKKPASEPNTKASDPSSSAKAQEAGGPSSDSTSPGSSPPPESTASPGSGVSRPMPIISGVESNKPKSVKDIYGIEHTQDHVKGPWMEFKKKFGQSWRPIQGLPPRGSIYVNGLIEITTPRAFITIDATAFWDPKTETFDTRTTNFRLRTIRMRTQSPKY